MTREQMIERMPHLNPDLYADESQRKAVEQRLREYVHRYTKDEQARAAKVQTTSAKSQDQKRARVRIERSVDKLIADLQAFKDTL